MKFATPDIAPLDQYDGLIAALDACSEAERIQRMRYLARTDLFFLVRFACNRPDLHHPFFFERCREVQAEPTVTLTCGQGSTASPRSSRSG
jgi:hypothetical protein